MQERKQQESLKARPIRGNPEEEVKDAVFGKN